jgi:hypothetical protein
MHHFPVASKLLSTDDVGEHVVLQLVVHMLYVGSLPAYENRADARNKSLLLIKSAAPITALVIRHMYVVRCICCS